ncbi:MULTISPECIES: ZirU family protein [Providencia]|uniref:ZirU family protein n=2 Tax=Providencia TaxID=586 RepID=A0AB35LHI6_PRORE|nr:MULTISPECIES: ZirU family protein [Providencia]MBO8256090.1 hypothetical protein [Providencia rettgeri]MBO8260092.1 hypothetical protein [Providencia rettgeri]MDE4734731.1 ZirU family protein [Providencia rettgeri]MDH2307640.1 ZirU family protein [Providencia rettgeri]
MSNKNQQTPMIRKNNLSVLIAGAVLGMTFGTSALAATTQTPISITSPATTAVIGHAPELKAGTITATDKNNDGVLGENDELKASGFDFSDKDNDTLVSIVYEWHDGKNVIAGQTSDMLKLTSALLGKNITVKAVAKTDPAKTEPSESVAVAAATFIDIGGKTIVGGTNIPTVNGNIVKSVTISGLTGAGSRPLVGDSLKANVTCHGTCDNNLTYKWQIQDSVNSSKYTDISGATTATYTVKSAEQKRKIQVIVSNK